MKRFNEHKENSSISDIISSINNYDTNLLKKSISSTTVNKEVFKIFDDDKRPLWTPLIKISTLKKLREDDLRYNGISTNKNEDDDCKLAEIIINNGADLDNKDIHGNNALHYSVYYGNYKLMKLLINKGADINMQDHNGDTPLQSAVMRVYASRIKDDIVLYNDFCEFLIQNGANKNIKNFNDENFFTYNR